MFTKFINKFGICELCQWMVLICCKRWVSMLALSSPLNPPTEICPDLNEQRKFEVCSRLCGAVTKSRVTKADCFLTIWCTSNKHCTSCNSQSPLCSNIERKEIHLYGCPIYLINGKLPSNKIIILFYTKNCLFFLSGLYCTFLILKYNLFLYV